MKVHQLIEALKNLPFNPYNTKVVHVQTNQDSLEVEVKNQDGTTEKLDYAWDGQGWVNVHE